MPTQCSLEEMDFGSAGGRKRVGAFDGGAVASNLDRRRPLTPFTQVFSENPDRHG